MPLLRGTSAVAGGDMWIVSPILSFLRKGFAVPGWKAELRAHPLACGSHSHVFPLSGPQEKATTM